jgi:hypothetical protein
MNKLGMIAVGGMLITGFTFCGRHASMSVRTEWKVPA